jgi:hypothetical protein
MLPLSLNLATQWADSPYRRMVRPALAAIFEAGNHTPRWEGAPDPANAIIPGLAKSERLIGITPGSYIWAISGVGSAAGGFRIQLTNPTNNQTLYNTPARFPVNPFTSPEGVVGNLLVLPEPLIVPEPGLIRFAVTNLDAAANTVECVLHIAEAQAIADNVAQLMAQANNAQRGPSVTPTAANPNGTAPVTPATSGLSFATIDISANGDNLIIPASAGGTIIIQTLVLYNSSTQDITLKDGTGTNLFRLPGFGGGSGWNSPFEPAFRLTAGNGFYINLGNGFNVTGYLTYTVA